MTVVFEGNGAEEFTDAETYSTYMDSEIWEPNKERKLRYWDYMKKCILKALFLLSVVNSKQKTDQSIEKRGRVYHE